ncbi:hypothetical protein R80B4_00259 [Fibrobacteres bacterium R8-0-B4]
MALSKSIKIFLSRPATLAMLALAAVLSDETSVHWPAAYWVLDRIEEGIAVLENLETLRTEERRVKDLPADAVEGRLLTDGGVFGGALTADMEATAARAEGISERFERLKASGGAGSVP